jgi:hypothetical protein
MPGSECPGKSDTGPRKRIGHEANGIELVRRSRWGLNGIPTGKRWADGYCDYKQCFPVLWVARPTSIKTRSLRWKWLRKGSSHQRRGRVFDSPLPFFFGGLRMMEVPGKFWIVRFIPAGAHST